MCHRSSLSRGIMVRGCSRAIRGCGSWLPCISPITRTRSILRSHLSICSGLSLTHTLVGSMSFLTTSVIFRRYRSYIIFPRCQTPVNNKPSKGSRYVAQPSLFQRLQAIPFHPLFFVAYPVLALVGININEVEPTVLWRPLIILLLSASALLMLFGLFSRDWHRAALLLSLLIFLFFTYGHVYAYLK